MQFCYPRYRQATLTDSLRKSLYSSVVVVVFGGWPRRFTAFIPPVRRRTTEGRDDRAGGMVLPEPRSYHALPLYAAPLESLRMETDERRALVAGMVRHAGPEGFAPGSLHVPAAIAWHEELTVLAVMFVWLGGPLIWTFGSLLALFIGSWRVRAFTVALAAALSFHPMPGPGFAAALARSPLTLWLYKYFSYRFVWCDDDMEQAQACRPWIGTSPPHGVLPFANILSIPAINTFGFKHFAGAPASVVFNTPFLRYLTLFECVPVDRRSIEKTVGRGVCVGIVPDGVAGIFTANTARKLGMAQADVEVVAMKSRRGLARLALRTGTPIVPAYSFGNTAAFSSWYDRFGVLEALSRKLQASLFLYWGRWGLPIPRRAQITMVVGRPIDVQKTEGEPTEEQIDELHERILEEVTTHFNRHKAALGWAEREIIFT